MGPISFLVTFVAPIFITISPLTSYTDQIWSIHKTRSSAGFSLDIPLIMLVASILRVFYWFGAHFDTSLLIQALIMILMQLLLLHTALSNRSTPSSKIDHTPFAASHTPRTSRPYDFWQWRTSKPYWEFLFYFTLALLVLQFLAGNITTYVSLIGYLALGIEALLPLPQILNNHRSRSCAGFRLSVLASWILGDVMKMVFFFLAESSIPWAFKCCGLFQFACDLFLGWQYWRYGNGGGGGRVAGEGSWGLEGKDVRLA